MRHPLVRLLSAYRNKFVEPNPIYPKHIGTKIIQRYRPGASLESQTKGHDVQFHEFVQYLIDTGKAHKHFDQHWAPYEQLCDPCAIRYHGIMKLESLNQDFKQIKDKIYPGIEAANIPPMYKNHTNNEMIRTYYANLDPTLLQELTELYRDDFTMYGYEPDLDSVLR